MACVQLDQGARMTARALVRRGVMRARGADALALRWSSELGAALDAVLLAVDPVLAIGGCVASDDGGIRVGDHQWHRTDGAVVRVVGLGKPAPRMVAALVDALGGDVHSAWAVGKHDHEGMQHTVLVRRGGHPLPDAGSVSAGRELLAIASRGRPDDLLLIAIAGGASSLACVPAPGETLATMREHIAALMACGTPIAELNAARGALDRLKHGGLARAAHCHVIALVLVDVPSADVRVVGSGVAWAPERDVPHVVLADNRTAVAAAIASLAAAGRRAGEGPALAGDAFACGRALGLSALELRAGEAMVCGGETTTVLRGDGKGGRTLELALGAATVLDGRGDRVLLAFATDGDDGNSGAAGAIVDDRTVSRIAAAGLSIDDALSRSDTDAILAALDDRLVTGATSTNVCDLVIALADPRDGAP